ncbi:hypothetical protein EDD90_6877 [Streptomyces sp. Ag109_O5-1]|uniref:hypothetical protein n=1 Tax=Streptomyces sp. Ag109_O5-1 TaxID=1938851 RepID=UPI000FAD2B75|nr:hypothetical protein [Streptomyces sp. Ag109_O5-1]RPE43666.1 hypothetical protein EDD90_6877 [Streptomyces sp. Ag109_O5-1]
MSDEFDASEPVDEGAFGIDAFSVDDRLRLFHFAAAVESQCATNAGCQSSSSS